MTAPTAPTGRTFAKGHGTANDFVLVPDPAGQWDPSPEEVAVICDRRTGIGADGLIRAVRSASLGAGVPLAAEAEWFMDYRNADGSLSEMCGNGVRVYAEYLLREGFVPAEAGDGRWWSVATRGGIKRVRREADGQWTVHMGPWRLSGGAEAARTASDALVGVPGLDGVPRPALSLDLGNPHTVVALAGTDELAAADLTRAPVVEPVPPYGTNVELVVPLHSVDVTGDSRPDIGEVVMRVHERGVGETRSCGTGACAAALATRLWAGAGAPDVWRVDVPGGQLTVTVEPGGSVEAGTCLLTGPAVIVADGVLAAGVLEAGVLSAG
ncbi:diaminopimelate epimerase [Kineococcus xinjiangensis]|uniref:Diaminopimelate epimerase n=1 Tax=Kineococcus xinjiangensis TaxID=512762 RepID=A0A2S6IW36_9ACTN|nr:diaminopimelate epimerase [Kineococcus xinjiangensis]PPK98450.1 diaminopimelate epimerase [Kineococcus xinjiangensis]